MKSSVSRNLSLVVLLYVISLLIASSSRAEDASVPITWSAFLDGYYAHDFNDPPGTERPYTTQALRDDEFRINLGYVDAKLDEENFRGRLAVQGGDSVKSNYSSEPDRFWRYIQESTFGYKLSDKLWLDGGIYLAHIGFESFISRDNWNYTRSLVAEYSPYYETGLKLSYQFDDQWAGQLHVIRGWQNISDERDPALGMQLSWTPTKETQLTYNNFIGDEDGTRFFNEIVGRIDLSENFSLGAQLDLGSQSRADNDDAYWHGWSLMSRYKLTPKLALGARVERYSDPHQILVSTVSGEDFAVVGLSANIDYELLPQLFWRTEYRTFLGQDDVFPKDNGSVSSDDSFIVTSLSYTFKGGSHE